MSESKIMPIFSVMRTIRDARSTKNAPRELLYALAMRCDPAKKFICWPSYRTLALDTQLDEVTLKRAAKLLEDDGIIRRVVRANRSNCFFLNIALLQEQAAAVKAADDEAKCVAMGAHESPFADPIAGALETAERDQCDEGSDWNAGGAQ
jgi:hypothetical protein